MKYLVGALKITFATVLLFATACSSENFQTLATIESGSLNIELAAPDGTLKMGENAIQVRVIENQQAVAIDNAQLSFWMPPMGTMERMDIQASLFSDGQHWSGTVDFSMAGAWNGVIEIQTMEGTRSGNFSVQVQIPE